VPFPDSAPTDQVAVCVVEAPGGRGARSFGSTSAALLVEEPRFIVKIRGARDGATAARLLAEQIRARLDVGDVQLSGVRYLSIRPERPVYGPAYDKLELPTYFVDCEAHKEPSAA
jgi:hypothetical protein